MAARKSAPPRKRAAAAGGDAFKRRVIVKFHEHVALPYDGSAARRLDEKTGGDWRKLADAFPGIALAPLFATKKADEIVALERRASETDRTYRAGHLLGWYAVDVPTDADPRAVLDAVSAWRTIATAYVEPPPVEPPLVNAANDPRSANQGYLDAAPDGIDAEYAWGFPGGDGAGQALVDLEWGWTLNHEDLAAHGIALISGLNHSYYFHGTGVLGEIAAADNALGCVGITPALASVRCVGQWRAGGGYSTSQPILDAAAVMAFGDVLLLEAQTSIFGYVKVPVETEPAVFDVIRLATALGIVVVEAAGNGGVDLDTVVNPAGERVLDRSSADFLDSGAILVGAATSLAPHARLGFSCHGSRIDCYGWGENVDTLSSDATNTATNLYTSTFNGTSSASPIVTGAALAVQGLAQAGLGQRFAPWRLRALLADPAFGTASQNPAVDRIGVMPNLRALIDGDALNLAPDVYLRDFVGDDGDAHNGAISASPDVILRPTAVADPQASFGAGSGTENDNTLGAQAEAGQDNFVYVRVRNRGGSDAIDVRTTVYWSPPSTLVTPDLWTLVGDTTLAGVPAGDVLTVAPAIVWPAAAIPATGHYCFVALTGTARDPAPAPADFLDWNNYTRYIRENNNVTWRNFNVVDNVPPSSPSPNPPNFVALPFLAAGAPDRARRMGLEIVGKLPRGAVVLLELPVEYAERWRLRPLAEPKPKDPRRVFVRLGSRTRLEDIAFPAKARIAMRLLVQLPKAARQHAHEVFARQLFEREEVGRVTWRLVPPRKQ